MSSGLMVMLVLAAGTYVLKAAGPLLLGNRTLPPLMHRVLALMPGPLLAALVVTSAFAQKSHLVVDARAVGLLAAVIALSKRAGFITVVIVAAVATAAARRLGMA